MVATAAVPFFDMAAVLAPERAAIDAAIKRVLDSGVFIGGAEVTSFESELAAATRTRHAIGVSSGTDALHVTGMALGIGPGTEVVTTPLSFYASAGAFARLGARLVFADVDDDTLGLDPRAAASVVTDRTAAVVPVHLYGLPARHPAVPCPVIEDGAQSLGTTELGGLARTISFFPTKNLGALGDAGAVLTDDDALAARLRLLRTQGAQPKYHHLALGGNFRLDALQAAVLRARLPRLAEALQRREHLAARYRSALEALAIIDLRLPPAAVGHTYHQFVIRDARRDALRAHLTAAGIGTEIYYPRPLHLQPCFAGLGYRAGAFPIAERACREVLALPIHPALAHDAQDRVIDAIAAFYR